MSVNGNSKLNTKQLAVNMFFSIIAFALNLLISFFITPYITAQFGSEAYGFVKLANDFTSYASLFSIAVNSMARRFLMLERARGNIKEAQSYFSSIFLANIVLSAAFVIPSAICIFFLDKFLVIPDALIFEVKLTFAITFAAFLGNLSFSTYGNCYYLTNRLSYGSVRDAISNIIRVSVIVLLFAFAVPRISYVALGAAVSTMFVVVYNIVLSKKLLPEFKFDIKCFSARKLWAVISSGLWNSITRLSQILSSGLDLMVTNLFIGSEEMGYLAVAKTVPNIIATFNSTIANLFSPNMMELYAKGEIDKLKSTAKTAMSFMCLFVSIPNAILITMGKEFFSLWVPDQPAKLLCAISVLTVINSCVTGPLAPLYQIFSITNKVRQSSVVLMIYGFVSIIVTYICLKTTSLGLFAVAGVSLVGSFIVAFGYHLPFAAINIGLPWYTFFPKIGKSIISLAVQCLIGFGVNSVLSLEKSWFMWFWGACLAGVIGLLVNSVIILDRNERKILISKVRTKLKRIK